MPAGKVSIIIPAYNAEKWIGETIRSALAQTWDEKEIIVVDDGSTDKTLDAAKEYESEIVRVISQPNSGASTARNRGLREAQGDFIQYLDADDLLSPTKIEEQVELLLSNPPGVLAVSATTHFFDGDDPQRGILLDGWPMIDTDVPLEWLIDLWGPNTPGGMVHPAAWLVPRSLIELAGFWNERLSLDDDGEYFARVVLTSNGIRRSRCGCSYYRKFRKGGSLSSADGKTHQWSALHAIESIEPLILQRTQDPLARQALAKRYKERAISAYPKHPEITKAALSKVKNLGGCDYLPAMGARLDLLKQVFGWKAARIVNALYYQYIRTAKFQD